MDCKADKLKVLIELMQFLEIHGHPTPEAHKIREDAIP